jgi:multiphosphoryl transfer protein
VTGDGIAFWLAKEFDIGVLIPMVTTESDVVQVASRLHELAAEMGVHELPRIGAMIETPAAALTIPSLKKHVDFFSIGSNDLIERKP